MIDTSARPNSVYVSLIQIGCSYYEFDITYPIHLNDIISPNEFRESINRINNVFPSFKKLIRIVWILFSLTITIGTICFIVAGVTATKPLTSVFYILISIGTVLTTLGSMFIGFGSCILYPKRQTRMRQAIAEESMKYSLRSPIPCSWRLDTSGIRVPEYAQHHNNYQPGFCLVIDIDRSTPPESGRRMHYSNKVAPEPVSFYEQQNNYLPPPYSDLSAGFCPQCNTLRSNLTAKFCSSCGHSFNKY